MATSPVDLTARDSLVAGVGVAAPPSLRAGSRTRTATAWARVCFAVDAAMLVVGALLTWLGTAVVGARAPALGWTVGFIVLAVALISSRGLYRARLHLSIIDDLRRVLASTTIAAMSILSLRLLLGRSADFRADSLRPWILCGACVAAGRTALYVSQRRSRRAGHAGRATLIVGAGRVAVLTAKRLLERPELGLRPVAFLDKEPLTNTQATLGLPVVGASWDLDAAVAEYGAEQVIVTFSTAPDDVLLRLVRRCEELGLSVAVVPRLFERVPEQLTVEHLGGIPLMTSRPADPRGWQLAVKYVLDRIVAAGLLLLLSPLFVAIALAVRLTMGSPVLFRQLRIGRDGRPFDCLKFRSMRNGARDPAVPALAEGSAPGGVEGEDRRTPLGALLRRTSLDELPQLVNVLRGEMSLVGPRPERPEFVSLFEENVYRYDARYRMKAGITGWAQVNGLRGKTSISDRAEWDNFYIENFSLWHDLKIVFMTAKAAFLSFRHVE